MRWSLPARAKVFSSARRADARSRSLGSSAAAAGSPNRMRSSYSTPAPVSSTRSSSRATMRGTSTRTSSQTNRPATTLGPRRGILGGAVLLAIGGAFLLPPLGVPNAGAYLFVALGLAFAAAWCVGARQYVYLVPACVLIGFGLGLVIPTLFSLAPDMAGPVFLLTLAGGLVAVSLLAPIRRAPLLLAGVLAVVAIADVFLQIDLVPLALQPYFVPVVLIIVGLYLLVEQGPGPLMGQGPSGS